MLPTPALEELPVYLLLCVGLGGASGFVALTLARGSKFIAGLFDGGGSSSAPGLLSPMPLWLRPAAGGLFCGALGLAVPEARALAATYRHGGHVACSRPRKQLPTAPRCAR
jgi:hypothetical protein